MKIKIDGWDIEGTPEEIRTYISLIKPSANLTELATVSSQRYASVSSFASISKKIDYDKLLFTALEYYKKGFSIDMSLKKSGMKGQNNKAKKLFSQLILDNGLKILKHRFPPKENKIHNLRASCSQDSILRKRGKFLTSRANTYMKYQNLSREEAFRRACDEWNVKEHLYHKKTIKSDIKDFPEILNDRTQNTLLHDVLKNIVANGTKMTYFNEGNMLGAETPEQWNLLLNTIVKKSADICDCFFSKGKFYIELIGKGTELRYKKN